MKAIQAGDLCKSSYVIHSSIVYRNKHGIWVKGNAVQGIDSNPYGLKYKRIEIGMPAMFICDFIGITGVFLVEEEYVELYYNDLEELWAVR